VQAVRYSPSGSHFASAGFDGKVFLYDGSSADLIGEIGSPAHKGGVYAVSVKQKMPLYLIMYLWLI
jgi:WD40 repeat protein